MPDLLELKRKSWENKLGFNKSRNEIFGQDAPTLSLSISKKNDSHKRWGKVPFVVHYCLSIQEEFTPFF